MARDVLTEHRLTGVMEIGERKEQPWGNEVDPKKEEEEFLDPKIEV